jgi:hypothetical protein
MKPKYNLEPFYMAIFLSGEEWIRSPRARLIYTWLCDRIGDWGLDVWALRRGCYFLWAQRYIEEGSGKGHLSPHMWLQWGNQEGGSFTEDFERQFTIWSAPPLVSPRDTYKTAVETGVSLHRGPVGGTWRTGSFTGNFERWNFIFIGRPCSLGTPRHM